ncbi:MAG: hypothetical protein AAGF89_12200 [Bacteroidota bacterium]
MVRYLSFFGTLWLLLLIASCSEPAPENEPLHTVFYHWETSLRPSPTARGLLDSFACEQLYLKVFDLSWEDDRLTTSAWLKAEDTSDLPALVPVVFITNEVLQQLPAERMSSLAEDLLGLTDDLMPSPYSSLQLDCDWTATTRSNYFSLLRALQSLRPYLVVSCTVRLHQYRDREAQGIPPVKRATLMAYNTGELDRWETGNSILDSNIVKGYLSRSPPYPIPLDLGVAIYDWAAVYRQGELAYLINEPPLKELTDSNRFRQFTPLRYEVTTSTYYAGLYLYRGDLIRRETVGPTTLGEQTRLLQRYVKSFPGQRRLIYRLGSRLWESTE